MSADQTPPATKRNVVRGYTEGLEIPGLAALGHRILAETEATTAGALVELLEVYDRGPGVAGQPKNLIFAANGPKPEMVLIDAVNNDITITRNGEYCLVYDRPVPADGLQFRHLVHWWRDREQLPDTVDDQAAARALHTRLRSALDGNPAEEAVFDAYARRYGAGFDIAALVPQVYLHLDPYSTRYHSGRGEPGPLKRQRMDFLLLFSDRGRVVVEVDGQQHYATDGRASPRLYAEMVAEDRRLRLDGYEVYRFGSFELLPPANPAPMLDAFFDRLAGRMKA